MANAPNLLNDDGSASMATAIMMSHHGFRRDTARFRIALERVAEGDQAKVDALKDEWKSYHATLHGHHEAEDDGLLPGLRTQQPALVPVIDRLTADHRRIDPLLEEGDRVFAGLPATVEAARALITRLSALLDPHLATEEAQVIPFFREAKGFPPPSTEAEVEMYAQGFAWASHGVALEVLEKLNAILPEKLIDKLPTARAAFAERCDRVWGPTPPGASRTPVPDWLAGD